MFYFPESSYAHRAAQAIAAYIALRGFGLEEPAPSLRESWLKCARMLGVRCSRDSDWNIFWENVCYHLVVMKARNSRDLTKKIRKEMRVATAKIFPSRGTYLLAAANGNVGLLEQLYELLRKADAIAAADAELFQVDRPTWLEENEGVMRGLLGAGVVQTIADVSAQDDQSWKVASYGVHVSGEDVFIGEERLYPHDARKLARLLLAAAHIAEQQG